MKELISTVSKKAGVDELSTKQVVETLAVELAGDSDKLTAFITASKPLHRSHLASEAAKSKAADDAASEAKSEKKSLKKSAKNT